MQTHNSRRTKIITGLIGTSIMAIFVIGLAKSIAEGFAGFEGALPFIVIVAIVLCFSFYNYYEDCVRSPKAHKSDQGE